jgi:hypothetical protein
MQRRKAPQHMVAGRVQCHLLATTATAPGSSISEQQGYVCAERQLRQWDRQGAVRPTNRCQYGVRGKYSCSAIVRMCGVAQADVPCRMQC